MVLDRGLPKLERIGTEAFFQRMGAKGAEHYRRGAEQRTDRQDRLQAGFFWAFFFGLCGRFLP
jgi:hypothetical protein